MSVYAKMVMPPQMTISVSALHSFIRFVHSFIRLEFYSIQFNSFIHSIQPRRASGGRGLTRGTDQPDCDNPVGAVSPDAAAVDNAVEGRDLGELGLVSSAAETGDALLGSFGGRCGGGGGRRPREGVRAGGGEAGGVCDGAGGGHCVYVGGGRWWWSGGGFIYGGGRWGVMGVDVTGVSVVTIERALDAVPAGQLAASCGAIERDSGQRSVFIGNCLLRVGYCTVDILFGMLFGIILSRISPHLILPPPDIIPPI